MIVSCPACATRFSLDAALLGDAGRNVRCAKCGHKWKQLPPKLETPDGVGPDPFSDSPDAGTVPASAAASPFAADMTDPLPDALAAPAVEIPAAPPRPRSPQRPTGPITVPPKLRPMMPKRRFALLPLYLLAGLVVGLVAAVFFFRAEIARTIPALDMVYSLMGLSTSNAAEDLQIGNLVFKRRNEDGKAVISIQADVFNASDYPVKLPAMMARPYAKDAAGNKTLLEPAHPFQLEQETIEPGETITFRTFFENPPEGTKSLEVTFGKLAD